MRIFLTGGNGFIGSVVVRKLANAGHDVVCLLRSTSNIDRLAGIRVTRADGDVRNVDSLAAGMAGCDATLHLAAPGAWEQDDPVMLDAVLAGGTRNVLEVAGRMPGHRVVVVSSTAGIAASDSPVVFDEDTPFGVADPTLYYSHAKKKTEDIARAAHARGVHAVIVNPAEVYGPGDTGMVTAGNLVDLATSTPALVCRGGTSVVHVDDVADGIIAAMTKGRPGERYILGGDNLDIREMAALVLELVGRKASIITVPNGLVRVAARLSIGLHVPLGFNPHVIPYATRYWFVNNAKARRELGVAFRDARATLGSTIEWLRETGRLPRA
jgi:dihydroflavonol-4-reductase